MSCNKTKEVWVSLIDIYKDMPYLWKKDDKNYLDQDMRAGFQMLLEIYKNIDKNGTVKTMKKKIKNMRTSFTKELKKVMASKHSRLVAAEVYVPSLWYFNALSFLGCKTESCTVHDSLENANSSSDGETTSVGDSSGGRQKRKKQDTPLEKQQSILLTVEKHMSQKDEEWEAYGRSIGFQMKDLNKRQLMISQKIISDVMFYAKLDQLSEYSCVVVRPDESISNNSGFEYRQNPLYSPSSLSNNPSPSPSQQTQSLHHLSPHYTSWPRYHTQSVHQPLPSPQQPTQWSNSPSPHQTLPNAQVQIHHTQSVHQRLQLPQNQMQLSNLSSLSSFQQLSRSYQPTSKGQVSIDHSLHLPSSDAQAHNSLHHHSPPRHPSPNTLDQAQPPRQNQELSSDRVVENIEQLLDYFPDDDDTYDANSLSLPVIEDPAEGMEQFIILKR